MRHVFVSAPVISGLGASAILFLSYIYTMRLLPQLLVPVALVAATGETSQEGNLWLARWHPPSDSWVNNLTRILEDEGVHGFIFNGSGGPELEDVRHAQYNFCNMPHVHPKTYNVPAETFELTYVEVIHRHHKRTPYQANTFPVETYPWDCSDQGLFYYGERLGANAKSALDVYWTVESNPANPFHAPGFAGTCQFPQITVGGLDDSWQHGRDLYEVYGRKLGFLPPNPSQIIKYRVTSNVITSQVAGMLISGMFNSSRQLQFPLSTQPAAVDSLQPSYPCPRAGNLYRSYGVGSTDEKWQLHLNKSKLLFQALDLISGVSPDDDGFHKSWDHYFDNLSARQCHQKPLPCKTDDPENCVSQIQADSVYRLGQYEYSYLYRDSEKSLQAAVGSYGVWIAELVQNIRNNISGKDTTTYRHNIAHDGSIARLLSILQLDFMVWPGMGAEIVFEIYKRRGTRKHFVRVLWGGKSLESSNPSLGRIEMLDVDILLQYFEQLVGVGAHKVVTFCQSR